MIVALQNKEFRLNRFPPIVGRKLMTKGVGVNGLLTRSEDHWLPMLAFVEVGLGQGQWVPLSTRAMLENHVAVEFRAELLTVLLHFNCFMSDALLSGPTFVDALWAEIYDAIEEAFK